MPSNKVVKKVVSQWTEEDMKRALHMRRSTKKSNRAISKECGVDETTLRRRIKLADAGLKTAGRKCALPPETEKHIADCIAILCKNGFSPTMTQISGMVQQYIQRNRIETPFKLSRPGWSWMTGFMKRNNLSLKKASMMCIARHSNLSNPFIIYDMFDQLDEIFRKYPDLTPKSIWNCDESGFPVDPNSCKVIGPKNNPSLKLTFGARRENITVLAVSNAEGLVLDPLIIFKGVTMRTGWRGEKALPNTYYSHSENGWMETDIFADWFFKFIEEHKERPLLLLFDGHMTHVSIDVIAKAIKEDVILFKFAPHITSEEQPLDKGSFGPAKRKWEEILNQRINSHGLNVPISKPEFINMLCSIWNDAMSPENAKSGFEAAGIWPLDRTKYKTSRFDPRLLARYNEWVANGKPALNWDSTLPGVEPVPSTKTSTTSQPDLSGASSDSTPQPVDATQAVQDPNGQTSSTTSVTNAPRAAASNSDAATNEYSSEVMEVIGPFPYGAPEGHHWVPNGWKLEPLQNNTSFEEILLDRIKPLKKTATKKRAKVDMRSRVISDKEYLAELQRIEQEKEEKEEQKKKRKEARVLAKEAKEAAKTAKKSTSQKKPVAASKRQIATTEELVSQEKVASAEKLASPENLTTEETTSESRESSSIGDKERSTSQKKTSKRKRSISCDSEDNDEDNEIQFAVGKPELPPYIVRDESEEDTDNNSSEEERDDADDINEIGIEAPKTIEGTVEILKCCWNTVLSTRKDEEIVGKWYAGLYKGKKATSLIIGKVTKLFRIDNGGIITAAELDCLKEKLTTADNILQEWDRVDEDGDEIKDYGVFPVKDLICGPLCSFWVSRKKWLFPDYLSIKKLSVLAEKVNRNHEFDNFICFKYM